MYEILGSKIIGKIKTLFKNDEVIKAIKKRRKKVVINNNKIQILKSKIKSLVINDNFTRYEPTYKKCK